MAETCENLVQGEVLQEFDFEGRPAQIVILAPGDADTFADDLGEHGFNLARNQETPNHVQDSDEPIDSVSQGVRQSLNSTSAIHSVSSQPDELNRRIQKFKDIRKKYLQYMIKEGNDGENETNFLGVFVDGRIVSIMGVRTREKLANGRQLYEFTNGSTLLDEDDDKQPIYARHGLSNRLKKTLFDKYMDSDPDAVWMGESKNPNVINSWGRSGWTVLDIDDQSEIAEIFRTRNRAILDEVYRKHPYKIGYFDPKLNRGLTG